MDSIFAPVTRARTSTAAAPLRRALPPPPARDSRLRTALLALAGVVVFIDIEFALAYLLYFAVQAAS
jgi:hypothetical protein